MTHQDLAEPLARERHLPGQHLEEDAAERVHVGAGVDAARRLRRLGRHVVRRTDDGALPRVARERAGARELREAEIEDLHVVAVAAARHEEDVVWLQIAMDDAARVRRGESVGDLRRDVRRALGWQRAFETQEITEPGALEQLHHDEAVPVRRLPEVLHVDDVVVADLRDRSRLVEEPRQRLLVGRELGSDHLQRHALADGRMLRQVHRAHRSLPDLREHLVVAYRRADLDHRDDSTTHRRDSEGLVPARTPGSASRARRSGASAPRAAHRGRARA